MGNNIVEELRKTRALKNKILARKIEKTETINDEKDNKKRAYSLFLKLVTQQCKKELHELDTIIHFVSSIIEKSSGWIITNNFEFVLYDDFKNIFDEEFITFDTYRIYRSPEGYHTDTCEPYNAYTKYIREKENAFLKKYETNLNILHEALTKKDKIMSDQFILKDKSNMELACAISHFLGYENKQEKKKKIIKKSRKNN